MGGMPCRAGMVSQSDGERFVSVFLILDVPIEMREDAGCYRCRKESRAPVWIGGADSETRL